MTAISNPAQSSPVSRDADTTAIQFGEAFVNALAAKDFNAIEALFAPLSRFRALTPNAVREATTAAGARHWLEGWFGMADRNEPIAARAEMVADVLHVAYRILQHENGTWYLVDQQIFASLEGFGVTDVALLCSGFRRVEVSEVPSAGAYPVDAQFDALGASCATLTPRIRDAVQRLEPGQVLEIVTDDPTAGDGLTAWTRMTGNELIDMTVASDGSDHFFVRRGAAR